MNLEQSPKSGTAGLPVTRNFFPHPADPNVGTTFEGEVYTRYVKGCRTISDTWRHCSYTIRKNGLNTKKREQLTIPAVAAENLGYSCYDSKRGKHVPQSKILFGRFALECFLGRRLEGYEQCRHGSGGHDDHSYTNIEVGDAINNVLDDVENGSRGTNLTYLIKAQARIDRMIQRAQSK